MPKTVSYKLMMEEEEGNGEVTPPLDPIYSECVADAYVGVKTHLCSIHTRPCTSAYNTCKVHVKLTTKKMHIYIYLHTYVYACISTR